MKIRPRKQFGQHWLRSDAVLQQILAAATLVKGDRILEIGPGKGVLTHALVSQVSAVVAVEIDRDLCEVLVKKFADKPNFLLLQGDILTLDLEVLLQDFPRFQQPTKVVANIPYNITGPILERLLGRIAQPRDTAFTQIVLLVQKEVAERICAEPGGRSFGALSVRVQYLADCEYLFTVPAQAFSPPPKVESAVIRLRPRPWQPPATHPQLLETLIRVGFATKRKMLRNNLKGLLCRDALSNEFSLSPKGDGYPWRGNLYDTVIQEIFPALAIAPEARAEELGVDQWVKLSDALAPWLAGSPEPPQAAMATAEI